MNVFDRWRGEDLGALAEVCGADPATRELRFEAVFPTGLGGTPPHLDVLLTGPGARPTAIESKFTEIYGRASNAFRPSYFERPAVWEGLPRCEALARRIASREERFEVLGAAQLLKHTLGLRRAFGPRGFRLLYLWYEVESDTATIHRRELDRFAAAVEDEIDFGSLTYHELYEGIEARCLDNVDYLTYLLHRYFS